jgi:hypothetical protein
MLGELCWTVDLDCLCFMAAKLFTVGNNDKHGNEVGLDCLCTVTTKLFTLDNHDKHGNKVVSFRAKMT